MPKEVSSKFSTRKQSLPLQFTNIDAAATLAGHNVLQVHEDLIHNENYKNNSSNQKYISLVAAVANNGGNNQGPNHGDQLNSVKSKTRFLHTLNAVGSNEKNKTETETITNLKHQYKKS